ncbi:succinate dehydrogenase cytochrome b subunit [Lipingzhangella sp. LS1_29]|uniref:Succinate dehydrogenase cytochrome b subunit n=1 Tax=Lipingzhangella rawalii TaxID=2055835 RepID=A0ABU2HBX5_9ACTN|nr:succinate dehydrogenase cytochrome b subunit [Lipingzhangella rawalii]MDS1272104.1 succinate dehydrogenase cytochrome b subunit [Lipingzhangella rawalii]
MATTTVTQRRSYRSTVVLKATMAVSGLLIAAWLVMHMVGNLKIFEGQQSFDEYSAWLRTVGYPAFPESGLLWIMRVVLLAAIIAHIYSAVVLTVRDRRARPVRYQTTKAVQRTYASYTMRWGGLLIAVFVVYHLLHLTANVISPGGASDSPYERVVNGFQIWWVTAFYVLSVAAVGLHLRHGIWSGLATLGFNKARRQRAISKTATVVATLLFVGFVIPPLAVLIGVVE